MTTTWADGFGTWHVRVSRTAASPLIAARRVLRDELTSRDAYVDRGVWMHPVRVPDLDTDTTIVYKEGTPEVSREEDEWVEASTHRSYWRA